jgi:hypothetical protein
MGVSWRKAWSLWETVRKGLKKTRSDSQQNEGKKRCPSRGITPGMDISHVHCLLLDVGGTFLKSLKGIRNNPSLVDINQHSS